MATDLKEEVKEDEKEKTVADMSPSELFEELDARTDPKNKKQERSVIDSLMEIIYSQARFSKTPGGYIYATFDREKDRTETHPVVSKAFQGFIQMKYYQKYKRHIPKNFVTDAVKKVAMMRLHDIPETPVASRVFRLKDGVYVNLTNGKGEMLEIRKEGWRVVPLNVTDAFKFIDSPGMLSLPYPIEGGNIEDLKVFINLGNSENFILTVSWLLMTFNPYGDQPIYNANGGQGSGKSKGTEYLSKIVDPNSAPLLTLPGKQQDIIITANKRWILPYENISSSKMNESWSDIFCRISTGASISLRTLYSDDELTTLEAKNPVILNSIDNLISRGDLGRRSIVVNFSEIPTSKFKTKAELEITFTKYHPLILGALCNIVSDSLRYESEVKLKANSSMADFEHWIYAAEHGNNLPWEPGIFHAVYRENRLNLAEVCLASDPVADAIKKLVGGESPEWGGMRRNF